MKDLFKQKWFQIFIGWLISNSILKVIFDKRRQKEKEEEEALLKRTNDIFDKTNEQIFTFPEFHVDEFKPTDLQGYKSIFDKED